MAMKYDFGCGLYVILLRREILFCLSVLAMCHLMKRTIHHCCEGDQYVQARMHASESGRPSHL